MTTVFRVPDATCGHCKATIETAVTSVGGVDDADLDLDTKVLRITHDDAIDPSALAGVIAEAGYSPEAAS